MSYDPRITIGVTVEMKVMPDKFSAWQRGALSSRELLDYGTIQRFSATELDTSKEEQRVLHNG